MNDSLRILLVEDNPGDADLLVELLPSDGTTQYEVECVARLSEALEYAGEGRFDIVLLDLGLPDSDGLATLRTMLQQTVELPIIVLTGNNDEQMGLDAIRDGAQDYLIKGQVDRNLLTRSIKYAIERKQAELALREEIAERLRTMEALCEKEQMLIMQSRQAAMGEMIGNIAHQWRQPLNTLGLTIQSMALLDDLSECNREFLAKGVSTSMELIQHMAQTIDDFRNYFNPDKEKVEFKVHEAVLKTLSLLKGSLQCPQINIEIVAKDDPVIWGFPNEFAQVLFNILNNAKDALLETENVDRRVTITICNEDGSAVLNIADNAGGIPEEILGKIFDPYFTTKGPQHGTGIGLFMSKAIIEKNMGGRLSVRNIANGAEFRIELSNGNHI